MEDVQEHIDVLNKLFAPKVVDTPQAACDTLFARISAHIQGDEKKASAWALDMYAAFGLQDVYWDFVTKRGSSHYKVSCVLMSSCDERGVRVDYYDITPPQKSRADAVIMLVCRFICLRGGQR
jgi:hypothetical protein